MDRREFLRETAGASELHGRPITVRLFKWDVKTMPVEAIDRLEAFQTIEFG